VKPAREIG